MTLFAWFMIAFAAGFVANVILPGKMKQQSWLGIFLLGILGLGSTGIVRQAFWSLRGLMPDLLTFLLATASALAIAVAYWTARTAFQHPRLQ